MSPKAFLTGIVILCGAPFCHAAFKVSERLHNGRYQEILTDEKQPRDGEWAFARYCLTGDRPAYEAALKAEAGGDLLAKFVVLCCRRDGTGVKRDFSIASHLKTELEAELRKTTPLPPAGAYLLSRLGGITEASGVDAMTMERDQRERAGHLHAAAEGGFAQALCEEGETIAKQDPEAALARYRKAADAGLAEGMKNVGMVMARGYGPMPSNAPEALKWTRQAAGQGSVNAMLNMAAFYEVLRLPDITAAEAVSWMDKAEASGSPQGIFEKGLGLLRGARGYKADRAAAVAVLQKAAASGDGFILARIAGFYTAEGKDLGKNPRKALEFAKAAWIQGNADGYDIIAAAYSTQGGGPDTADAPYWRALGSKSTPKALQTLLAENPGAGKALSEIDPFSLKVE